MAEETVKPEEIVEKVETEIVEQEKVAETPKSFAEMTEEEKLALSDDDFIKNLYASENGQIEKDEEVVADDEEKVGEEKQEKEVTTEEEYERLSKLSDEEFLKEPREKKGLFYEMRKERSKRQALEQELEKEREIRKAQLEIAEKLRGKETTETKYTSETEKVKAIIQEKAEKYEAEYGEEYRLTYKDVQALDEAKAIDSKKQEERAINEMRENEKKTFVSTVQTKIDGYVKQLKESGYEDFDYVYANFIDPVINPEIAKDKDEATQYAAIIMRKMMKGENAMKYAYDHLARLTPDGEKYFQEKKQKEKNKELATEATKITTKTSSHVQAKPSNGKIKVTLKMLNEELEKWDNKLTKEQFAKVFNGEDVYI